MLDPDKHFWISPEKMSFFAFLHFCTASVFPCPTVMHPLKEILLFCTTNVFLFMGQIGGSNTVYFSHWELFLDQSRMPFLALENVSCPATSQKWHDTGMSQICKQRKTHLSFESIKQQVGMKRNQIQQTSQWARNSGSVPLGSWDCFVPSGTKQCQDPSGTDHCFCPWKVCWIRRFHIR